MFILLTACEGTWSHKEEKLLKDTVSQMGSQERGRLFWTEVSNRMGRSRGRQQCREKWCVLLWFMSMTILITRTGCPWVTVTPTRRQGRVQGKGCLFGSDRALAILCVNVDPIDRTSVCLRLWFFFVFYSQWTFCARTIIFTPMQNPPWRTMPLQQLNIFELWYLGCISEGAWHIDEQSWLYLSIGRLTLFLLYDDIRLHSMYRITQEVI